MNDNRATNRRELLRAGLGLGLTAGAPAAVGASLAAGKRLSEELDLSTPDGNLRTYVKLLGSIADSIAYISFQGTLWGLLPGRAPTAVCGFHGLARYNWQARDNDTYYQKSFDVGYFSKLDSGERLDTMINPLTDETIEPYHYKYGGYERLFAADGASWIDSTGVVQDPAPIAPRWQLSGDQLWFTESRQGDVPSPLDAKDWPREAPGERYVYGGETTFAGSVKQLSDATVTQADYTLFWSSVLSWEPWLLMDGVPGFSFWRGVGHKLHSVSEAPADMLAHIAETQPNYFEDEDPWSGHVSNLDRYRRERDPA